jgi:hypothetical protein
MYLQVIAHRARVPRRKQGDGCIALHFQPDFGSAHRFAPRQSGSTPIPIKRSVTHFCLLRIVLRIDIDDPLAFRYYGKKKGREG